MESVGATRSDALHFREHRFQSRAAAYDLIKLAISIVLITRPKSLDATHNVPPNKTLRQTRFQPSTLQGHSNTLKQNCAVKRLCNSASTAVPVSRQFHR